MVNQFYKYHTYVVEASRVQIIYSSTQGATQVPNYQIFKFIRQYLH